MQTYNFDELTNRRNTNSMKWDVAERELPMWVADMDFKTAPAITEALKKRAAQEIFGYTIVPDSWYEAYMSWWERRHQFKIDMDWLVFSAGVIPTISSAVRKLTTPAEKVIVQTPVYNIFFNSIYNNGRNILESPLQYDGETYHMDFEDLEAKCADPQATLMLLCNPHNPVGKIWSKEELARIGEICERNHVTVISDEIHCDLIDPGFEYVPFASASETCKRISITCIAPTKTFNIAGLQTSAIVAPDPFLRHKITRAINTDEVAEPNVFAVDAAVAAFQQGEEWLLQLQAYLAENRRAAAEYIGLQIPKVKLVQGHATYLLWLDVSGFCEDGQQFCEYLREKTGLFLSAGIAYGLPGKGFLRMNIACPRERLEDGLNRLREGVLAYEQAFSGDLRA